MGDIALPATILLYITGATSMANIVVNGIRTSYEMPAAIAFGLAVLLGFLFVILLMIANGVAFTYPLLAGAAIGGVLVGGASAGSNAVHNKTIPTSKQEP